MTRTLVFGLALSTLVGCGGDPDPGKPDTGATPREIGLGLVTETLFRASAQVPLDDVLVLVNHADGSLVDSWRGDAVPEEVSVVDGDLVTAAYKSDGFGEGGRAVRVIDSYRVSPGVESMTLAVAPSAPAAPACATATMRFMVHVPAVPGATHVTVRGSAGGLAEADALPADIEMDARACATTREMALFVTAEKELFGDVVAFQLVEGIAFHADTSVDVTASPASDPRTPLEIVVDKLEGATKISLVGRWDGALGDGKYPSFLDNSSPFSTSAPGKPFTFAPDLMDLPGGAQAAFVSMALPSSGALCGRGASLARIGRSDAPVPFHVTDLAEATPDGDAWRLDGGRPGDAVVRTFSLDALHPWSVYEDPSAAGLPAVFPTFPADAPADLDLPRATPKFERISTYDWAEFDGYADSVAAGQPPATRTLYTRSGGVCTP